MVTPHPLASLALARMRVPAALAAAVVPAYMLLERSRAEQMGGAVLALADIARGAPIVAPASWLALAAVTVVLRLWRRDRTQVPIRASRPN